MLRISHISTPVAVYCYNDLLYSNPGSVTVRHALVQDHTVLSAIMHLIIIINFIHQKIPIAININKTADNHTHETRTQTYTHKQQVRQRINNAHTHTQYITATGRHCTVNCPANCISAETYFYVIIYTFLNAGSSSWSKNNVWDGHRYMTAPGPLSGRSIRHSRLIAANTCIYIYMYIFKIGL